jgi:16S rRNA (uracil1498-N3)-methyltransferase
MSTTYFYHTQAKMNERVEFESSEATHITKALRMKSGEFIELTNGRGKLFTAELSFDKHRVSALIKEEIQTFDTPIPLHLGIAPTKNADRIEWLVEKAVELGIGEITLIQCAHSERSRISIDRMNRVAIAALKQSQRTYLPRVNDTVDFLNWLNQVNSEQRFIAHCMDNLPRTLLRDSIQVLTNTETNRTSDNHSSKSSSSVCIAIGPEGDFSEAEILAAQSNSFKGVSLGNARLRTETAALAAVHTFNLVNQH